MKITKSEVRLIRLVFGMFLLFVLLSAIQSHNIVDWVYIILIALIEIASFFKRK